jgi:hypothetical protein
MFAVGLLELVQRSHARRTSKPPMVVFVNVAEVLFLVACRILCPSIGSVPSDHHCGADKNAVCSFSAA